MKTPGRSKTAKDEIVAPTPGAPSTPASSKWIHGINIEPPPFRDSGKGPRRSSGAAVPDDELPEDTNAYLKRIKAVASDTFAAYSTVPVRPRLLSAGSLNTKFACGLYLSPAATGAGKTLNAVALTLAMKDTTEAETAYHYVYEARSIAPARSDRPESPEEAAERAASAQAKGLLSIISAMKRASMTSAPSDSSASELMGETVTDTVKVFKDPSRLLSDLQFIYGRRTSASKLAFVVIDSLTLAIKQSYPLERSGSAAGEKGSQPADIKFIFELSRFCLTHNLVCLGLVNSELVQFTHILEGVCEGQIQIQGAGNLRKRDRIYREWQALVVPDQYFSEALEVLGYRGVSQNRETGSSNFGSVWI